MIRSRYAALDPPGPIIHVAVRSTVSGARADQELALIDSGADCTVLPGRLVSALGLEPVGTFEIAGVDADSWPALVYYVEVFVPGRPAGICVQAAVADSEPRIFLGRDVLNHLRVLLDGPGLAVEFE